MLSYLNARILATRRFALQPFYITKSLRGWEAVNSALTLVEEH